MRHTFPGLRPVQTELTPMELPDPVCNCGASIFAPCLTLFTTVPVSDDSLEHIPNAGYPARRQRWTTVPGRSRDKNKVTSAISISPAAFPEFQFRLFTTILCALGPGQAAPAVITGHLSSMAGYGRGENRPICNKSELCGLNPQIAAPGKGRSQVRNAWGLRLYAILILDESIRLLGRFRGGEITAWLPLDGTEHVRPLARRFPLKCPPKGRLHPHPIPER